MQPHHNAVPRPFTYLGLAAMPILFMLGLLSACAHQKSTTPEPDSPSLSEFQWAVLTGAAFYFVEQDEVLLPAQAVDTHILESMPPKKRVHLLGNEKKLTIPLQKLLSPYAIDPKQWTLQFQQSTGWVNAGDFHFTDRGFITDIRPEPIGVSEFAHLRFLSR